jgi:hypothetical protein
MTDTFRALCAELLEALESWSPTGGGPIEGTEAQREAALITRARAALAQPEPESPTDEELEDFALQNGGGYFNCDCQEEEDILTQKHVSNYRAVLARWGHPTPQPIPISDRLPGAEGLAERGLNALRNQILNSQDDYDAIFAALKRLADLEAAQDSSRENI